MKLSTSKKFFLIALTALFGFSLTSPAQADWHGREGHGGYYYHNQWRPYAYYPGAPYYRGYYPASTYYMPPPPYYVPAPQPYYGAPVGANVVVRVR